MGRPFAHINASALYYTGKVPSAGGALRTIFVTKTATGLVVRARDHGAREWLGLATLEGV